MGFEGMNRILFLFGYHPFKFGDVWQRRWRQFLISLLTFNFFWNILIIIYKFWFNNNSLTQLLGNCYYLINITKLFFFNHYFEKIIKCLKEIMNLLCKDASKKASENLKYFNYFSYAYLTFYLIQAISITVITAFDSKLSNEHLREVWPFETNVGIIQYFFTYQAATTFHVTEIFGLCFQCCYFNICMNVRMLHDKVLNEYQNLVFYHVISYKKELKDVFTSLQRIKLIINEINECFKMVIFISFFVDVLSLGVCSSMIEDHNSIVMYFMYTPFVLYDVWVYCYGSSLMVEKIEEISLMIYDKNWWMLSKSEKKMFRTLLQYTQRPLKIKVLIWNIDRELLILLNLKIIDGND